MNVSRLRVGDVIIPRDKSRLAESKNITATLWIGRNGQPRRVLEPRRVISIGADRRGGQKYVLTRGLISGQVYRRIMLSRIYIGVSQNDWPNDYLLISRKDWPAVSYAWLRLFEAEEVLA